MTVLFVFRLRLTSRVAAAQARFPEYGSLVHQDAALYVYLAGDVRNWVTLLPTNNRSQHVPA